MCSSDLVAGLRSHIYRLFTECAVTRHKFQRFVPFGFPRQFHSLSLDYGSRRHLQIVDCKRGEHLYPYSLRGRHPRMAFKDNRKYGIVLRHEFFRTRHRHGIALAYYEAVHTEKDFNLYNTPVLDFIKASQDRQSNATIAIMCSDSAYGNGLRLVLLNLSKHILVFETPEAARKELGKKKPMLWIVTEPLTKQPDQPWRAAKRTPVILLSNQPESEIAIEKNAGKLTVLPLPVLPETLRNAVKAYLLTKEDKN